MALEKKNLLIRSLSGAVYIGLIIGAIVIGPIAAAILAGVFAALGAYELENNTVRKDNPSNWVVTWAIDAVALICLVFCMPVVNLEHAHYGFVLWVFMVFIRFVVQVFINQQKPLKSIGVFALEQFYLGVPLALFVVAVGFFPNPWFVVCAIAMIWINDTGAYLVGCTCGRHKMFPRLSPKKSWEGFWGGLLFNVGAAFIYYYCFDLRMEPFLGSVVGWIYIGICVSVFATIGDLFESMLKRSIGIKDFGTLIPGHGGILDRIDSLLFVVPYVIFAVIVGCRVLVN